jgi:hypothetical protein
MVIGTFFSEVGTGLLTLFSDSDLQLDSIKKDLSVRNDWSQQNFLMLSKQLKKYRYRVEIQKIDITGLRNFLKEKRDFLLRLLENPTLLEHESFTELLRAVFHLAEELEHRKEIGHLPHKVFF